MVAAVGDLAAGRCARALRCADVGDGQGRTAGLGYTEMGAFDDGTLVRLGVGGPGALPGLTGAL